MRAVLSTYLEVYRLLYRCQALLVRFGAALGIAVLGFWALCTYGIGWVAPTLPIDPQPWIYFLLGTWFFVHLAVRWHRFLLLDEHQPGLMDIRPGRREFQYLVQIVKVGLAASLLFSMILSMLLTALNLTGVAEALIGHTATGGIGPSMTVTLMFITFQSAAFAFGLARLGLVLPAAALGVPMSLRESWRATAGRGLPFFALIVLVNLPAFILECFFTLVDVPEFLSLLVYMAAWWVTIAATATALSFNYAAVVGRPGESAVAPTD